MEIKGKGRQGNDDGSGDGDGNGDGEMQIKPRSTREKTIIAIATKTVFRQNLYLRFRDYLQCNNTSDKHQCNINSNESDCKLYNVLPLRMVTYWLNGEETSSETESALEQGANNWNIFHENKLQHDQGI